LKKCSLIVKWTRGKDGNSKLIAKKLLWWHVDGKIFNNDSAGEFV